MRLADVQQLQALLGSHWGHFAHTNSVRLRQQLLAQMPWLATYVRLNADSSLHHHTPACWQVLRRRAHSTHFETRRRSPVIHPIVRSALLALALVGAAASVHSQSRYTYSTAGDEVTDTKTGFIWRRCSEGQTWRASTCTGSATTYTHEQALAHATAQAGAAGWRLPNVKELSSITDKTRTSPAIDTTAFPGTPSNGYWSSTPYAGDAGNAWVFNFGHGDANGSAWVVDFGDGGVDVRYGHDGNYIPGRYYHGHVRLVR